MITLCKTCEDSDDLDSCMDLHALLGDMAAALQLPPDDLLKAKWFVDVRKPAACMGVLRRAFTVGKVPHREIGQSRDLSSRNSACLVAKSFGESCKGGGDVPAEHVFPCRACGQPINKAEPQCLRPVLYISTSPG